MGKAPTRTVLKPTWQAKPSVPISKPTRPMPVMPTKQSMIEKEMMDKKPRVSTEPMRKITPTTKKPR